MEKCTGKGRKGQ